MSTVFYTKNQEIIEKPDNRNYWSKPDVIVSEKIGVLLSYDILEILRVDSICLQSTFSPVSFGKRKFWTLDQMWEIIIYHQDYPAHNSKMVEVKERNAKIIEWLINLL